MDELIPLKEVQQVLRAAYRAEGARRDRRRRSSVRRQGHGGRRCRRRSAAGLRWLMRSSFLPCERLSAKRRRARSDQVRPDELAADVMREALNRAPGVLGIRDRGRHSRLRDAGSRAGTQRRAHREPSRGLPGRSIGRHDQQVLRLGSSGHRVCRRPDQEPDRRAPSWPAAPRA